MEHPLRIGLQRPTVSGGKVYLTDLVYNLKHQRELLCVDANTGKIIWTYSYAASMEL